MVRLSDHWSMWSRVTRARAGVATRLLAGLCRRAVAGIVGSRSGAETLERSANNSRSNLSTAAARQASIEHRGDAGLNHLQNIDGCRRAAIPQVRDLVISVLPDGDVVHREVHIDHRLGRPALIVLQRKGCCLSEPAEPHSLVNQALSPDPFDVIGG